MFQVKPSPKQARNMAVIHNFGFHVSSRKTSLCHSAWIGETLTLLDLWSVEGNSIALVYGRLLDEIRTYCNQQVCSFRFYASEDLKPDLTRFATENQIANRVKIQSPMCDLRDALEILVNTETTDQVSISPCVDEDALERILSPADTRLLNHAEMMSVIFALAEPLHQRSIEDGRKMLRR